MINAVAEKTDLIDVAHLKLQDVITIVRLKLAELSQLPSEQIDLHAPIFELGLSSVLLVDLNFYIKEKLGVEIPIAVVNEDTSIQQLCEALLEAFCEQYDVQPVLFDEKIAECDYKIEKFSQYYIIEMHNSLLDRAEVESPFFRPHLDKPSAETTIQNQRYLNFASYNYLDLCGHPAVDAAAIEAIRQYGTSASSSRIVSGERPVHQALEKAIAQAYQVDDALALVSGHATNVTTIGHFMGRHDLILCDKLSHNSINQGAQLAKCKRFTFAHNDMASLETLLKQHRANYKKVLIVTEGLFSMDGDIAPLPELIALKKRYQAFLMIDEAHSFGVLGKTGCGIAEYFSVDPKSVDIWMGTLSKSLAGCGGYLAGSQKFIEYMRYQAPGFLFSVGMSPALAAASHAALQVMLAEPERVAKLAENSQYFCQQAKAAGFNIGTAQGYAVVPIIVGNSIKALKVAQGLFQSGIDAQAIIYPAIAEDQARVRFFVNSAHTLEQIDFAIDTLKTVLA